MKAVTYPPAQAFLCYHNFPGEKPTHVYLAGLGLGATGLYPSIILQTDLSQYHTLIPDFLGFGYSDQPDDFSYTVDEHANSVIFLLDQLQLNQCTLIGHSFGGAVAIVVATKRPDLVAKLVLAEAVRDAGNWFGAGSQSKEQWITDGHKETLELFRQYLPFYQESDRSWWPMMKASIPTKAFYRTALSCAQGVIPTWREQLYQLKIPRLFLFGEASFQLELESIEETKTLPNYGIRVNVLPQAGHNMMSDNPSAFASAIIEFEYS
jgi:pimeloyl-ACP methyl ester carboxylesterase